jgi:tetratricopeptide (TPR) repeat protein
MRSVLVFFLLCTAGRAQDLPAPSGGAIKIDFHNYQTGSQEWRKSLKQEIQNAKKNGDLEQVAELQAILNDQPTTQPAQVIPAIDYASRGTSCLKNGKYSDAIVNYNLSLRNNPHDARTHCNRGFAYAMKNQYDKAIADYTKAIKLNPDLPEAYSCRAWAYEKLGDYDKAIDDYTEAIRLNPENMTAKQNRKLVEEKRLQYAGQ